jgi:hypothetical protein
LSISIYSSLSQDEKESSSENTEGSKKYHSHLLADEALCSSHKRPSLEKATDVMQTSIYCVTKSWVGGEAAGIKHAAFDAEVRITEI